MGPAPNIIARNTGQPVYFSQALGRIVKRLGPCVFLEAALGGPIIPMARSALSKSPLPHIFVAIGGKDPAKALSGASAELWRNGLTNVQYWAFHRSQRSSYGPVALPPYQFEKSKQWLPYTGLARDSNEEPQNKETLVSSSLCFNCLVNNTISYITGWTKQPINQSPSQSSALTAAAVATKTSSAGHAVVGSPICPAAMYLQLASHAVTLLPDV
jgi:acyl transferase domain-containing protein